MRVIELNNQLSATVQKNEELKARNARLASDIKSLQEGDEAIEDRARSELAMVKRNEIFVQLLDSRTPENSETVEKTTERTEKSDRSRKN